MSNDLKVFNPAAAGLPAELASVFDVAALAGDLTNGAGGGFQVISIRGSKWRIKVGGEEKPILNENGEAIPSIEAVIVKSSDAVSKIYYAQSYTEGDDEAPACSSIDGVTPDAGVANRQSDSCTTCPHNVWGSRITDAGKKSKECSDSRRLAIWMNTPCPDGVDDAEAMLLRVPAASLNDLTKYGSNLTSKGFPYNALVTRIGFDLNAAYPKLTFKAIRPILDEDAPFVAKMFNSDVVEQILNTDAQPATEPTMAPTPSEPEMKFEEPPVEKKAKPAKKAKGNGKAKPAVIPEDNEDADLDNVISNLASLD